MVGAQTTVSWQVRLAVSEVGQLVLTLVHGGCMMFSVGEAVAVLLENVSVWGADVWPTGTLPKFTLDGVNEGGAVGGPLTPLPDKPPLTEPPVVLMVSKPL